VLDERRRELLLARGGSLITAVSQDARGQARNRELALKRLAEKIASGLDEPARRRPTRPTRASRVKRLEEKRRAGERKRGRQRPGGDY
jgi:ribosome-associated protein